MSKEGIIGAPQSVVGWSEALVITWAYDWHLKGVGQSCRTEPSTCGIWVNSVKIKLNCRTLQLVSRGYMGISPTHIRIGILLGRLGGSVV